MGVAVEQSQILKEIRNSKISIAGNTAGFLVGVGITYATIVSPSFSYFIVAWGAMIFCPIYAVKALIKLRNLKKLLVWVPDKTDDRALDKKWIVSGSAMETFPACVTFKTNLRIAKSAGPLVCMPSAVSKLESIPSFLGLDFSLVWIRWIWDKIGRDSAF